MMICAFFMIRCGIRDFQYPQSYNQSREGVGPPKIHHRGGGGAQRGNSSVGLVGWVRILGPFLGNPVGNPWETRGKPELLVENSA